MSACAPDGTCKAGADLAGMPLPLKVTVDFENTVVSAVDHNGYPHMDNFDAVADSGDQLTIRSAHYSWHRWRLRLANGDPQWQPGRRAHLLFGGLGGYRLRHLHQ